MRVFFNDEQKIIGVFADDADVSFVGAYEISVPFNITKKLDKTIRVAQQKHTSTGDALFTNRQGSLTTVANVKSLENTPVMEEVYVKRAVSLLEAPYEWSVLDVLTAKYEKLSFGRKYWFDEFLTDGIIDKATSIVNSGVFSLSVPPQGKANLLPVQLMNKVGKFDLYLEGASDLDVEVSGDGTKFLAVRAGVVSLPAKTDKLVFRFTNPADSGVSVAIDAVAIFY
jgi:hypothetical protein